MIKEQSQKIITRFAPSPSGEMHIGNIRTALICWLYAKTNNGKFILRIDNTNEENSKQEFIDQIKHDLLWLSLNWDQYLEQKDRLERYKEVAEILKSRGVIYPCYETPQELEIERKILKAQGRHLIYRERQNALPNRNPHWRMRINTNEQMEWDDLVKGKISINPKHISDPIVIREDGTFPYMLPSSIDDIDYEINTIIRGDDHITNTGIQIQIMKAIGMDSQPKFAHIPLVHSNQQSKISKRNSDSHMPMTVQALRKNGILPMAIKAYLSCLGTQYTYKLCPDQNLLEQDFDISKYSSSSCQFCNNTLNKINISLLQKSNLGDIKKIIPEVFENVQINESIWSIIKHNIKNIQDLNFWNKIANQYKIDAKIGEIQEDTIKLIHSAKSHLPMSISKESCNLWIKHIQSETMIPIKIIYKSLRHYLTGSDDGPELYGILELLGRDTILKRLQFIETQCTNI